MQIKRAEIIFTGRVQGVGFRYTAESLAVKYGIVGYVKNLPDGGVEVVGEGKEKTLKLFLDAIQAEMARHIEKANINWFQPEGSFKSFSIRY